jgi:polyphenol oxidase
VDFAPPADASSSPLRTRPAAHSAGADYVAKFNRAIAAMKALPADDPRSFAAQASVHCAYCDGSYSPDGFPGLDLQVHNSWLFMPFHRCYLYFFERILGSLIGDPTFAIPFWNWDAPDGMRMPAMYTDQSSPLFDPRRNGRHVPPKLIDLDYNGREPRFTDNQQVDHNLRVMYRQVYVCAMRASMQRVSTKLSGAYLTWLFQLKRRRRKENLKLMKNLLMIKTLRA